MRAIDIHVHPGTREYLIEGGGKYIADAVKTSPDVFIGFASVDPWKGRLAIAELERAGTALSLRGLKLHPIVQAFWPNDRRFYPLWETCVGLDIPVMFHTGTTGVGAGVGGGNGLHLKYGNPMPALEDRKSVV